MANYDPGFIDTLNLLSFIVGVKNYQENLTQNDKAEIMNRLDEQTKEILLNVKEELEKQNTMLAKILQELERR